MKTPHRRDPIDISFRVGLALKGAYAAGEFLAGIAMIFMNPGRMDRLVHFVTRRELAVDPDDRLMNAILTFGHAYTLDMQKFVMIYLLLHGVLKTTVILLLVKKVRWAYPVAAVVFFLFIVYQGFSYLRGHSPLMLYQSALDAALVVLVLIEYRRMLPKKDGPAYAATDEKGEGPGDGT